MPLVPSSKQHYCVWVSLLVSVVRSPSLCHWARAGTLLGGARLKLLLPHRISAKHVFPDHLLEGDGQGCKSGSRCFSIFCLTPLSPSWALWFYVCDILCLTPLSPSWALWFYVCDQLCFLKEQIKSFLKGRKGETLSTFLLQKISFLVLLCSPHRVGFQTGRSNSAFGTDKWCIYEELYDDKGLYCPPPSVT